MNTYTKCSVESALNLIKKKWVVQILRDLFFGKSRFSEFKKDKPKLSNKGGVREWTKRA